MRNRRERVCVNIYVSKANENINVLETLAKHRCDPIVKQNVYQWSASLLESGWRVLRFLKIQL